MAAPAFGFSVGDFIAGINLVIDVFEAFKETGGASSKYASQALFLEGLRSTLGQLKTHVTKTPSNATTSNTITKLLSLIDGPLGDFDKILKRYKPSLDPISTRSKFRKTPKLISFTVKDIVGSIDTLRQQIAQSLQQINTLLLLEGIQLNEELSKQQSVQIVDALLNANVPASLDRLIQQLSAQIDGRHDEHFKIQQDIQTQVAALMTGFEDRLNGLGAVAGSSEARSKNDNLAQIQALKNMQTGISNLSDSFKERADGTDAAVAGLAALTAALQASIEANSAQHLCVPHPDADPEVETPEQRAHAAPSMTPHVAYLAVSLLSSVVTGIAAVSASQSAYMRVLPATHAQSATPFVASGSHQVSQASGTIMHVHAENMAQQVPTIGTSDLKSKEESTGSQISAFKESSLYESETDRIAALYHQPLGEHRSRDRLTRVWKQDNTEDIGPQTPAELTCKSCFRYRLLDNEDERLITSAKIEIDEKFIETEQQKPETERNMIKIKSVEERLLKRRLLLTFLQHQLVASSHRSQGRLKEGNAAEELAQQEVNTWNTEHRDDIQCHQLCDIIAHEARERDVHICGQRGCREVFLQLDARAQHYNEKHPGFPLDFKRPQSLRMTSSMMCRRTLSSRWSSTCRSFREGRNDQ